MKILRNIFMTIIAIFVACVVSAWLNEDREAAEKAAFEKRMENSQKEWLSNIRSEVERKNPHLKPQPDSRALTPPPDKFDGIYGPPPASPR